MSIVDYLMTACDVCEHGSSVSNLTQIVFEGGRLSAFNGIIQYQAPSGLEASENFAVSEKKLLAALRACGDDMKLDTTKDFLRLKNGPLSIRVRKIEGEQLTSHERIKLDKRAANQKADELHAALRRVQPFISTDASRIWSVSAMVKGGYVWATNNMSLVRSPISIKHDMVIPAPMVDFLCALPSLGHYDIDDNGRLVFSFEKSLVRCPQSAAPWPDLSAFFAKMPKKLPEVPEDMATAASMVGKFADRFASVSSKQIESKQETIEATYDVDFAKGKGTYSAKLLTLVLAHATHIDFSYYPDPIFFKGEGIEGTAVGMKK